MTTLHTHSTRSARALRFVACSISGVRSSSVAIALIGALALSACGGGEKAETLEEKMAKDPEAAILAQHAARLEAAKAAPPPSDGPPPPTDAELKAWDRKDPAGETHLYKWDKANYTRMAKYFEELDCFREEVVRQGDKAKGTEPGSPEQEQWTMFKSAFVPHINGWQQRLFGDEPHILEKSKLIGHLLEGHELVMRHYLEAYNNNDDKALQIQDAHWTIVMNKVYKYADVIGAKWPRPQPDSKKWVAAHEKTCKAAMTPPDRSKQKKQPRNKTPI